MKTLKLLFLGMLIVALAAPGTVVADTIPDGCTGGGIQLNLYRSPTGDVHVGDTLTYTISASVGNFPPNCAIYAVTLSWSPPGGPSEDLIGGTSGNPAENLAPGAESTVFMRTYVVDAADMIGEVVTASAVCQGLVQNSSAGQPGSLSNDDDLSPAVVISNPDTLVGITVTDPTGPPSHPTNLVVTEKNTGEDPLYSVFVDVWADDGSGPPVLLDTLLAATASGDSSNPGVLDEGAPPPNGETWSWTIGPFAVNAFTTYTALGYGIDPLGKLVSFDEGYTGEKATGTADIEVNPALTIVKNGPAYSKHEGPWGAGDTITYDVTITIGGDWPLILDTLVDDIAGDQSALLPAGPQSVGTVIGPLYYTYDPQPGDPDPLVNVATVTAHADGYPAETATANDDHSVILLHPDFTVTKQCTTDPVDVGDSAIFDITITNIGDADLDFTTDEATIAPFSLAEGAPPAVYTVSILVTEGMTDVFNSIIVTATLDPRYNLPNIITRDDDDTCNVSGGATRTPGFWQTHTDYTTHIATVHGCLPMNLGWVTLENPADIFGMFWSNNAWNSDGTRRTKLCQARVTVSFHAVAAILNSCLDNGAPLPDGASLSDIATILGGTNVKDIRDLGSVLGAYNESGDDIPIIDGDGFLIGNADPKAAKDTADYTAGDCDSTGKTKGNNK